VKIATWNVNSVRTRLPRLLSWLERRQPDIVCLQETKVPDEQFPSAELEAAGYRAIVSGEKTYNGVAILSRSDASDVVRALPGDDLDAPRRILVARIDELRVVDVYAPNGGEVGSDKYAYKLDWYQRLRGFLDADFDPGDAVALCGDLNIAPEDIDVWDPEQWRGQIMVSDPEREAFRDLASWGLADSLRRHHPGRTGLHTWWDYRAGAFHRGWGLRIDHILLSPAVARRCEAVEIDRDERKGKKPSDHAPVVATLA
jgi:exodeoxyribonuclease-3